MEEEPMDRPNIQIREFEGEPNYDIFDRRHIVHQVSLYEYPIDDVTDSMNPGDSRRIAIVYSRLNIVIYFNILMSVNRRFYLDSPNFPDRFVLAAREASVELDDEIARDAVVLEDRPPPSILQDPNMPVTETEGFHDRGEESKSPPPGTDMFYASFRDLRCFVRFIHLFIMKIRGESANTSVMSTPSSIMSRGSTPLHEGEGEIRGGRRRKKSKRRKKSRRKSKRMSKKIL
jgi:hypothetical protein